MPALPGEKKEEEDEEEEKTEPRGGDEEMATAWPGKSETGERTLRRRGPEDESKLLQTLNRGDREDEQKLSVVALD